MSDSPSLYLLSDTIDALTTPGTPVFCTGVIWCIVTVGTWLVSTLTGNYSQVDKLWSILPAVYACIVVCDARTTLMAAVTTFWSLRLTYNFYRRGGYAWPPWRGDEDYRWSYVAQGKMVSILANTVVWHFFNLAFISIFQNVLLLLIAAPSIVAHVHAVSVDFTSGNALTSVDFIAAFSAMTFICIEAIADNQQNTFQTEKYRRKNAGEALEGEYLQGFLQSGLFAIVRKPNYAAEQCLWTSYSLFAFSCTGVMIHWSAIGCILLALLFQGSGRLTERITREKYSAYAGYQQRVPLYVPSWTILSNGKGKIS